MTDQQPFAPPSGSPPPAAPPGAPATDSPPPPATPAPAPSRPWLVPVVVLSSLGFVAFVLFVIISVMITTPGFLAEAPATTQAPADEAPDDPAPAGDASCAGCFTVDDVALLAPDAARYAELGFVPVEDSEYLFDLGDDQRDNVGWWSDDRGDPDSCYFTYPKAPLLFTTTTTPDPGVADDPIAYPQSYTDESGYYGLILGVRVFDDPGVAAAHVTELERALVGCAQYALPVAGYAAVVEPAQTLDLPADVSAAGWVESAGPSRFYAYDLQRGNLVVRVTLNSDADGPSENEFRDFAEDVADLLGALP